MRIIFGILSSNNTADSVQQIIDAIGPSHTIIIHHDFSKQPEFCVTGEDVYVIEDYVETNWGGWSLVEATICLIEAALTKDEFDYFQLLSDTCLPIRPIHEFVDYLNLMQPDANIDYVSLLDTPAVMMSHGYRAFAAKGTIRDRLLRRLIFWDRLDGTEFQMIAGLLVSTTKGPKIPISVLQRTALRLAAHGLGFSHPFTRELKCQAGSQWFGGSRTICQRVLEWTKTNAVAFAYFKNMYIPDEFFFQTVILNLRPKNIMCSNHYINLFDKTNGYRGPAFLELGDFDRLTSSGKFFARKFSKNSEDPLRLKMLHNIRGI
jgi:hypothetical protein